MPKQEDPLVSITPFLWFDNNLEQALELYASVFPDTVVHDEQRGGPDGPIFTATFTLAGQKLMGLNGGPAFTFTEAVSLFVSCGGQAEVDYYWNALTAGGGEEGRCGWLKDRFGLSWQIVPTALGQLLGDPDQARAGRAMQAMLQMHKLDIQALTDAADNG